MSLLSLADLGRHRHHGGHTGSQPYRYPEPIIWPPIILGPQEPEPPTVIVVSTDSKANAEKVAQAAVVEWAKRSKKPGEMFGLGNLGEEGYPSHTGPRFGVTMRAIAAHIGDLRRVLQMPPDAPVRLESSDFSVAARIMFPAVSSIDAVNQLRDMYAGRGPVTRRDLLDRETQAHRSILRQLARPGWHPGEVSYMLGLMSGARQLLRNAAERQGREDADVASMWMQLEGRTLAVVRAIPGASTIAAAGGAETDPKNLPRQTREAYERARLPEITGPEGLAWLAWFKDHWKLIAFGAGTLVALPYVLPPLARMIRGTKQVVAAVKEPANA